MEDPPAQRHHQYNRRQSHREFSLVLKVDLKEDDYQPLVGWNVGRIVLQVLEILPTL